MEKGQWKLLCDLCVWGILAERMSYKSHNLHAAEIKTPCKETPAGLRVLFGLSLSLLMYNACPWGNLNNKGSCGQGFCTLKSLQIKLKLNFEC